MNITYESNNFILEDTSLKIDKNKKNILILGKASTDKKRLEILNPKNDSEAMTYYGQSDLYNAYKEAYKITKDNNIYTLNTFYITDVIEAIDLLIQYDFNYIVPTSFFISDFFIDPRTELKTSYLAFYLSELAKVRSFSTILTTDRHASLYEDIDDYIYEMRDVVEELCEVNSSKFDEFGNNAIFVLNNFKGIEFSNVVLAAILSQVKYAEHPSQLNDLDYKLVYDFDYNDIMSKNISYFKHNLYEEDITIDNFYNLRTTYDEYKIVMIDETIKALYRLIDLEEFKGRLYTPYVKIMIETKLKKYLEDSTGSLIKDYKIKKIEFIKTDKSSGYINIELFVMPYGSVEYLKVVMGV